MDNLELSNDHYIPLPTHQEMQSEYRISQRHHKRVERVWGTLIKKQPQLSKYQFSVLRWNTTKVLHAKWNRIYLFEGLVNLARNDSELAFILAHEAAHWEHGDVSDKGSLIPAGPWQVRDKECAADIQAMTFIRKSYYAHKVYEITLFLEWLKNKRHTCDN